MEDFIPISLNHTQTNKHIQLIKIKKKLNMHTIYCERNKMYLSSFFVQQQVNKKNKHEKHCEQDTTLI